MSQGYQVMSDATRRPTQPIQVPPTPENLVIFPTSKNQYNMNGGGSVLPSTTADGSSIGLGYDNQQTVGAIQHTQQTNEKGGGGGGKHGGSQIDPFELFKHQIGQKVGFSQWMWRYRKRRKVFICCTQ